MHAWPLRRVIRTVVSCLRRGLSFAHDIRAKSGLALAWQEPARFEGITIREYLTLGRSRSNLEPVLVQVGQDPDRYLKNRRVNKALSGWKSLRICSLVRDILR